MKTHTNWNSPGFSLPPLAPAIGPFGLPGFLSAVWSSHAPESADLCIVESCDALIALAFRRERLEFVGHRDLVDYRSPLGAGTPELVRDLVDSVPTGTAILFDSLPAEAAAPIGAGLSQLGLDFVSTVHATAAVLLLPASFDDYLMSIGKKERHELRRKRRRFEASTGPLELVRTSESRGLFKQFIGLHRRSEGEKGRFMAPGMELFFEALFALPGWGLNALLTGTGEVAAAAFGYLDDSGYYLYNSAFDSQLGHLSPGQVMLGAMIERAIEEQRMIFDFLKGDEAYKYRLGAVERPLYEIALVR